MLLLLGYDFCLFLILFVNEAQATDFDDLGKLLFGGFALAIAVAIVLVCVKLRLRDKNPRKSDFLSISNVSNKE